MSQVILTAINSDSGQGTILDLYENETISQTWKFTDISELKAAGGFSRQFSIPDSPTNVAFFGALDDVNAQSWFKFGKKVDAVLTVDTVPIAVGHIQVKRVVKTKDKSGFDYDVVFYTETTDLATAVGEKKIADIEALPDLNEVMNAASVTDLDAETVRYFLCDRGQKWSQLGEAATRPIWNPNNPLYAADLTPHVQALWLFDKIITEAGFVWQGETLADRLALYYVPFSVTSNIINESPGQEAFFEAGFLTDQTPGVIDSATMTEVYDNGTNLSAGVYTAPYTAFFQFEVWAGVDPSLSTAPPGETAFGHLTLRIIDTDTNEVLAQQFFDLENITNHIFSTFSVFLDTGQSVKLDSTYISNADNFYNLEGTATNLPTEGTGWRIAATSDALSNGTVNLPLNAPDVTQMAFLRDVMRMHNLAVVPDRNIPNKLYFTPFPEYLQGGDVKDWTGKLDESVDVVVRGTDEEQKKTLLFTYKAGGDANSKYYVDKKQRVYGDYKVDGYTATSLEDPSDFAEGELKIELTAQSTPCSVINGTPVPIPKFIAENGNYVAPGLRFLYTAGTVEVYMFIDGVGPEVRSVYVGNHYNNFLPTVGGFDLNFAPEAPLHSINGNPFNNLFNLYWRDYLNEIYSNDARVMEASFNLDTSDIVNFKFNDKIFIRDAYWRILDINNHAVGQEVSTPLRLIKILNPALDCEFQPVSVNLDGEVIFENAEGEEGASELCCTRYGYFWIEETDKTYCSAFPPSTGSGGQVPNDLFALGVRSIGNNQNAGADTNTNAFRIGNRITIPADAGNTVAAGQNIKIGTGNRNVMAVGDNIEVQNNAGTVAVFGQGVRTNIPGIHLGGGWYNNDRTKGIATQQAGTFVMSGQGNFAGVSEIPLYINGIVGKHINIPNESAWAVTLQVMVNQYVSGSISKYDYGLYFGTFTKVAGSAFKGEFNLVEQNGTLGNISIEVDPTTNANEHRLSVKHNAGTTNNGLRISASLSYVQVK